MKYFQRVFLAIIGRNPFLQELKKVENELKKERTHARDLQQLTENLRSRITDMDIEIEDMRVEQRGLREDLNTTLEKLQAASHAVANECMSKSMLDKTNHSLNDLASALHSDDEDTIAMAVQYLDWSNPMARIAQRYLNLLRMYHELRNRLDDDNVNYE